MAEQPHSGLYHFEEQQLMPAEEKLEIRKKGQKITIGIPANTDNEEVCIPLTPQAAEMIINSGNDVIIETGAGLKTRYSDLEYANAGAIIAQSTNEVFECDYVIKVAPFTSEEIALLRGNQVIFSMLQIDKQCESMVKTLMQKKITSVVFEYMKDELGGLPVMQSLSEISGIVAMTVAGELLSNSSGGKGVLFGGVTGISPAAVIILGAETAAESAARAALGLGAEVKIFDNSVSKLRSFERKFNQKIFTSLYYPRVLKKAIQSADVVLGAQPFNSVPQYIIPREMIQKMKKGSIIIDLNASQGGCFETTTCTSLSNPTYERDGIIHYCVPNISARVSRTTTIALSNIFASIILEIGEMGGIAQYIKSQKGFREGVVIYNGLLTNKDVGNKFNIPVKDLDLLMAAF